MSVGLITSAYPTQPTNLNGISFASAITRLMPNGTAPLFGLTSLLKDETASNIEHGYFSKTMIFPSATLSALVADGVATSFTVVAHTDINIGDMLMVASTQETVLVTGFADATHITVVRGVGTVAAAAIATAVVLYSIGNAFEEGSTRPSAVNILA
jgi:hypothetical protein